MRSGQSNIATIRSVILEFFCLSLLVGIIPVIIVFDTAIAGTGVSEISGTEFAQEILIVLSALLVGKAAQKWPDYHLVLVLFAAFLLCILIREMDFLLDRVYHGFWVVPASITAILSILYAIRNRGNLLSSMAGISQTRFFTYTSIGLIILLVFSRIFGTGRIWEEIMGENYQNYYKTVIQEGLELLGYAIIFFGATILFIRNELSNRDLN